MTRHHRTPNLENLSSEALLAKVKDDNDARERKLIERTQGRVAPGPGADVQKILTYCRFILLSLGELVTAELEIEATRAEALDEAEAKVAEHEAKSKLTVVPSGPRIVKP